MLLSETHVNELIDLKLSLYCFNYPKSIGYSFITPNVSIPVNLIIDIIKVRAGDGLSILYIQLIIFLTTIYIYFPQFNYTKNQLVAFLSHFKTFGLFFAHL